MTTAAKKQQAIFPDMPRSTLVVDPATGHIRDDWKFFFSQMSQALQDNFQRQGVRAPSQTPTQITEISNQQNVVGNIVYDSTANVWKGVKVTTPGDPPVTTVVTFDTTP